MGLWSEIWHSFPLIPCPWRCSGSLHRQEPCSLCLPMCWKSGSISLLLLARINYHWTRIIIIVPVFVTQHLRSFQFLVTKWESPNFPFFFFLTTQIPSSRGEWDLQVLWGDSRGRKPLDFSQFFFPPSCPISPTRPGSHEMMESCYLQPTIPLRFIPVQLPQEFQPPF